MNIKQNQRYRINDLLYDSDNKITLLVYYMLLQKQNLLTCPIFITHLKDLVSKVVKLVNVLLTVSVTNFLL